MLPSAPTTAAPTRVAGDGGRGRGLAGAQHRDGSDVRVGGGTCPGECGLGGAAVGADHHGRVREAGDGGRGRGLAGAQHRDGGDVRVGGGTRPGVGGLGGAAVSADRGAAREAGDGGRGRGLAGAQHRDGGDVRVSGSARPGDGGLGGGAIGADHHAAEQRSRRQGGAAGSGHGGRDRIDGDGNLARAHRSIGAHNRDGQRDGVRPRRAVCVDAVLWVGGVGDGVGVGAVAAL